MAATVGAVYDRAFFFGRRGHRPRLQLALFAAAVVAVVLAFFPSSRPNVYALTPDPSRTPGATVPVPLQDICAGEFEGSSAIPVAVGRSVFANYGIENPEPRAYELDYLIAPELGGSADTRNLWPQPYAAPVWNAYVKDALEDYLHELVCSDHLALAQAQQDISTDWIAAYKKYFQTEMPINEHLAFLKDEPWED
jgi:hypothetical protein